MLLIQISAAQGPSECQLAVKYTLKRMLLDAKTHQLQLELLQSLPSQHGYHSLLLQAAGDGVVAWAASWCGSIQWVFASPMRPQHPRKNWFVGVAQFALAEDVPVDDTIVFQTCRATGSGGQHVNTTDSAVHATHVASGISVKVMTERSQHANKKLARALIAFKLQQQADDNHASHKQQRHQQHWQLQRGNPVRVFKC